MTRSEALDHFLLKEGMNCLNQKEATEEDYNEPAFSTAECDCCGENGTNLVEAVGYNPTSEQVQEGYNVCIECLYMAAYGEEI